MEERSVVILTEQYLAGGNVVFRPGNGTPPGDIVFEAVNQVGEWRTSADGVCGYRIGTTHRPKWIVRLLVWVVLGWRWSPISS